MLIQPRLIQILLLTGFLSSLGIDAKATNPGIKGFATEYQSENLLWRDSTGVQDSKNRNIKFQINSDITYFNIDQFQKAESKQIFIDALKKTKESHFLTVQTDSLRGAYAEAADDEKEKIAAKILNGEKKIVSLNEEVPALFEKARSGENDYWQSATVDEKAKFIEKIRLYRDSLHQVEAAVEKQTNTIKAVPDTIIYYRADKNNEVAAQTAPAVVYKIQVGSFKTKMPDSAAKAIKKLELLRKVDNYKDEKGLTIYTTGSLKSYQEALTLQTQVKLEGIKNATIAPFANGKRVTIDEAKKLSNETSVKP